LSDIDARWNALREIRGLVGVAKEKNPALAEIVNVPYADIYLVDGSFKALLLLAQVPQFE
jgi:hypothetical protein